jgi:hypothetical protein
LKLQDYKSRPKMPGDVAVGAHWEQLLARRDVRAAVAKVGRILTLEVY